MSPNLRREIKEIRVGANDAIVKFKNGSTIEAVASGESSRGYRGNILILDEARLISQTVLNSIEMYAWVFSNIKTKKTQEVIQNVAPHQHP